MNASVHRSAGLVVLILCICCCTVRSQTTVPLAQASTVKGHVTLKDQPIAGVTICLRPINSNNARITAYRGRSDQDGNYRVTNIPNGSYQVTLEAPEFWVIDSPSSRVLILAEGETVDDVDFALVRGGVITGKVTASGNRPLIAHQILFRPEKGVAQSPPAVFETDDRGIYRIFGLQPGKYKVSVSPQNSYYGRRKSRFSETFYPATIDPAKAVLVEVTESGEVTGVDIAVEMNEDSEGRFSVSGAVVDQSHQQPVPNIGLGLQRIEGNDVDYLNVWTTSDAKGQFRFEDLAPGKYAVVYSAVSTQPDSNLRVDNTNFVVVDKDVTDLVVKALRKASVSGVVVIEAGQSKATLSQFGPMYLNAYVVKDNSGSWAESARIANDGSFYMKGLLSGIANFSIGAMHVSGPPKGLSISRVERDGIVQSPGLEIKDQEIITGVRIVLKYANGMIRGVVKLASGELPANAQVTVWLRNSQGEEPGSQTARTLVDARGHFVIEGIPDGTHEIEANVVIPRAGLTKIKQQVTVSSGTVTEVTLIVDNVRNP